MNAIQNVVVSMFKPFLKPVLSQELVTLTPKITDAVAKTNLDAAMQAQIVTIVVAVLQAEIDTL